MPAATAAIAVFVAHAAINPTEEWQQVIEYALRSCDACAALLAPGFKESDWTDQEVGFCMARSCCAFGHHGRAPNSKERSRHHR